MKYNYPIKQQNQYNRIEFDDEEYIDTFNDPHEDYDNNSSISNIEVEMSRSLFDMRREYKSSLKRLRNLYSDKEPKVSIYKFQNAKYPSRFFTKNHLGKRRINV